jgi:sigma-B regulation protein RsbU (phosphoserine phosphatase)
MEIEWNILFFGNDDQSLHTLTHLFKKYYTIFSASSMQECLDIYSKNDIHLVIIDQEICEQSGLDCLETLHQTCLKTIFILSGKGKNSQTIIDTMNAGYIFRYLIKPWNKSNLTRIIDEALCAYAENQANEHLIRELQCIIDEMKFLHKISQKISEKKPLPRLLSEIMESSKLLMNAEASSLLLYEPADEKLHFHVATGAKGKVVKKFSVDVGVGIAGWVAKHKKPLLIRNCYDDPRFNPEYDKKTKFHTRSMICVPLIRKKQLLGVIQVINKKGGREFEERDVAIFKTLASQFAIAIENHQLTISQIETEAFERELETAREIQQKLLPSRLPVYDDIQIAAKLIPAKQVGGDYYNILKITDEQSLFFITDVTGKGIPAALIVSTIYSCLNSYMKLHTKAFDLMTLVTAMNKVLIESTTIDKFATCWFGLYFHNPRKLISINAGHNPPYLFRKDSKEPMELKKGGLFLGGFELPFEVDEIQMLREDVLVFYTDGVTEAWNTHEEEYEEYRLKDLVSRFVLSSAEEILSKIEEDVKNHVGNAQQSDDFTCAVLKIL